jgi:hypothetical protein
MRKRDLLRNKVTSTDGAAIAYEPEQSRGVHGMVGRVLVHATMSLDGFIAGPDDAMDWVFEYVEPSAANDEVIKTTGAMPGGRRSYDVGKRDAGKESGAPYGGAWTGPVFVLTP